MATLALIPVAEYLATMYHPDCDYVDGEVLERNLGTTPHSGLQTLLATLFTSNRKQWNLRAYTEQRVQVSSRRFRIPDVCAVALPATPGPIIREAPVVCIEVLSPEDTVTGMDARVEDYLNMGVRNIWIIDPVRRRFWTADADGLHKLHGDAFTIDGTPVRITIAEINAELDDIAAGL